MFSNVNICFAVLFTIPHYTHQYRAKGLAFFSGGQEKASKCAIYIKKRLGYSFENQNVRDSMKFSVDRDDTWNGLPASVLWRISSQCIPGSMTFMGGKGFLIAVLESNGFCVFCVQLGGEQPEDPGDGEAARPTSSGGHPGGWRRDPPEGLLELIMKLSCPWITGKVWIIFATSSHVRSVCYKILC